MLWDVVPDFVSLIGLPRLLCLLFSIYTTDVCAGLCSLHGLTHLVLHATVLGEAEILPVNGVG